MKTIELPDNTKIGVVKINNLEEGLEKRVDELKIKKIFGEFIEFQGENTVSITSEGKTLSLPYDILVGADGAHSEVRNKSGIQCKRLGETDAITAFVPFPEPSGGFDISDPIKIKGVFIRKITLPSASIIFVQKIPVSPDVHTGISEQTLEELTRECNWQKETKIIAENKATISESITVILQQAAIFSNEQKRVILVGDAAAVASYFQGMGANTAFKAASIAGDFFRKIGQHEADAYNVFNQTMKETTDELINDSKYLFFDAG
jgi:2-polyprenyl-6-methoxyphenol hydroxylase-like FAD-dependent oxidoreductase